jgi:GT2 family glycosyltransferase
VSQSPQHPPHPRGVSVVIPACGAWSWTQRCLESLRVAWSATGTPSEVLLVDNASPDDTLARARELSSELPILRVLPLPENLGFAQACDLGLGTAQQHYTCFLNNDTLAPRQLLPLLREAFERSPRAGLVAPVSNQVIGLQKIDIEGSADDPERILSLLQRADGCPLEEVHTLSGLCLLGETQQLREMGGFAPDYPIGNHEDEDLCLRMRHAGLRLIVRRDAYLFHAGERTFLELGLDYDEILRRNAELHARRWSEDPLFIAEQLLEQGELEELARVVARIEPEIPAWRWGQRLLAIRAMRQEHFAKAQEHWRSFLQAHPTHTSGLASLVVALLECDEMDEAHRVFDAALRDAYFDKPRFARVLTAFARAAHRRGDMLQARQHAELALESSPGFVPALSLLILSLLATEQWEEVEAAFARHGRNCADPDIWTNVALARCLRGDRERGHTLMEQAARAAGPDSVAAQNLRQLGLAR